MENEKLIKLLTELKCELDAREDDCEFHDYRPDSLVSITLPFELEPVLNG